MLSHFNADSWIVALALFLTVICLPMAVYFQRRLSSRQDRQLGIIPIDTAQDVTLTGYDVIAIHGLGAHSIFTWTTRSKKDPSLRVHWLKDFLCKDFPQARVARFSHNADWLWRAPIQSAKETGNMLLYDLKQMRKLQKAGEDTNLKQRRPIIFVAHSYGGIILKQALVTARSDTSDTNEYKDILDATCGIIFLGTPHTGSNLSIFGWFLACLTAPFLGSNPMLLNMLRMKNSELLDLHEQFCRSINSDTGICALYETQPTYFLGTNLGLIVDRASASIEYLANTRFSQAITVTHSELNKCPDRDCQVYRYVSDFMKIVEQLEAFRDYKERRTRREMKGKYRVPAKEQNFTQKLGRFVERTSLLTSMQEKFRSSNNGLNVLVLHGIAGAGKTELAKQFYRLNKTEFTSAFKVSGKSPAEFQRGIANIRVSCTGEDTITDYEQNLNFVIGWLSAPGNTRWLLLIDGVRLAFNGLGTSFQHDPNSPAAWSDLIHLHQILNRLSQGTIIITSQHNSVTILGIASFDASQLESHESIDFMKVSNSPPRSSSPSATFTPSEGIVIEETQSWTQSLYHHAQSIESAINYMENQSATNIAACRRRWEQWYFCPVIKKPRYNPVIRSLDLIFDSLSTDAQRLVNLWSYLDHQNISFGLIQSQQLRPSWYRNLIATEAHFEQILNELAHFRLLVEPSVQISTNTEHFCSLHPVFHKIAKTKRLSDQEPEVNINLTVRLVSSSIPDKDAVGLMEKRKLLSLHAIQCYHSIETFDNQGFQLDRESLPSIGQLGQLLQELGYFRYATSLYDRALGQYRGLAEKTYQDNLEYLSIWNNQGRMYLSQMDFHSAKYRFEKVIKKLRMNNDLQGVDGKDHPAIINAEVNLALALLKENKASRAIQMLEKVIGTLDDSKDILLYKSKQYLAFGYNVQGRHDDAKRVLIQAQYGLKSILENQEDEFARKVCNLQSGSSDLDHTELFSMRLDLATTYAKLGNFKAAGKELKSVEKAIKNAFGQRSRQYVDYLWCFFQFVKDMANSGRAREESLIPLLKNLILQQKEVLGQTDKQALRSVRILGELLTRQGRFDDAANELFLVSEVYKHRETSWEKILVTYHLAKTLQKQADSWEDLARRLSGQSSALKLFEEARDMLKDGGYDEDGAASARVKDDISLQRARIICVMEKFSITEKLDALKICASATTIHNENCRWAKDLLLQLRKQSDG